MNKNAKKGGSKYELERVEEMSGNTFKYGFFRIVCAIGLLVSGFIAGVGVPQMMNALKVEKFFIVSSCLFIFFTVMFFVNGKKYKESKFEDKKKREEIIASVTPVKGVITNVVKYVTVTTAKESGVRTTSILYSAMVEYYDPSIIGAKRTIESDKFHNDISKLLRSNKVNIYFKPDGSGYYIEDFDVRKDEWDIQAKIPLTSEVDHTTVY